MLFLGKFMKKNNAVGYVLKSFTISEIILCDYCFLLCNKVYGCYFFKTFGTAVVTQIFFYYSYYYVEYFTNFNKDFTIFIL